MPDGDRFTLPLAVVAPPDGTDRLFVAEQGGLVQVLDRGVLREDPYLDASALIPGIEGGQGLMSFVFHPDYATNGYSYVTYTDLSGDSVLARYTVSPVNPHRVDAASALILLVAPQPATNHNGNHLVFGPDGYLYYSLGDGGGQPPDADNNAQRMDTLLGKVLRIDVDNPDPGLEYGIPPDNPFVGVPGAREEIWVYGLRNPWRFSFDRLTGDLFIGDVGAFTWEEIDFQPADSPGGENYGWKLMEADDCFDPSEGCDPVAQELELPILQYGHDEGCAVIGGYRYRGALEPQLRGVYLYADLCAGTVWGTVPRCDGVWQPQVLLNSGLVVNTFGEDQEGEVYLTQRGPPNLSDLYRLKLADGSGGPLLLPNPASLEFGNNAPNDVVTLDLELINNNVGPEALVVHDLALSDETHFTLDLGAGTDPCVTTSLCLEPGASCTLAVTFSSPDQGIFTESLTLDANSPVDTVPLNAVAFLPCPHDPTDTITGQTVDADEDFAACLSLDLGPDLTIDPGVTVTFTAGESIRVHELSAGAGAELAFTIDPLLAIE